jgi:outer membrane protein TolC
MASQEIPFPGKLRLRAEVAQKEADAETQQYRATTLSVLARLKQAFYRLSHTYLTSEVLERNRELLRILLRTTEERYAVGRAPQPDLLRVQTQLTLIETRLVQLEREQRARTAEINGLLSRPPAAPLDRPGEPEIEPLAFTADQLIEKARRSAPQLARDQKIIERAGTGVTLAGKDFDPDVTLNGGFFTMGSMGQMYVFRADVKLPVRRSRTRAEIAERTYDLTQAKRSYEAASRSLEAQVQEEYLNAQTAERLAHLYQDTVIPQARLTAESSLAAYENGSIDLTTVLGNYVAALEYEMNYHEQSHEFHLALTRLEEITGVELTQ